MNLTELLEQWQKSVEEANPRQDETSDLEGIYNVAGMRTRSSISAGLDFPPNDKYFTNQRGYWC